MTGTRRIVGAGGARRGAARPQLLALLSVCLLLYGNGAEATARMQTPRFYIIGHNPNTLQEAKDFMKAGANGLELRYLFR